MVRLLLSIFGGLAVTFALLVFMASLIAFSKTKVDTTKTAPVEFNIVKPEAELKAKERRVPRKPEPPKEPPPPQAERVKQSDVRPVATIQDLKVDTSKLGLGGDGPSLGGVMGGAGVAAAQDSGAFGGDSEAIPVATLQPRYPTEASRDGIEGSVCFKFTIQPDGSVADLEIYDSKPRRVFDTEARRAILKWKFRPAMDNGKPVAAPGKKYCMDFKLDQSE